MTTKTPSEVSARTARTGDEGTGPFEVLDPERVVEVHADFVWSLARRLARNEDEARELFQESFVRILRGLPSFERRSSLRTWICQVTINCDRNRRRWWARLRRNLAPAPPAAPAEEAATAQEPADPTAGPERLALSGEVRERIEASLGMLPRQQRLAVILRDVEGMSYEEISAVMGIAVGTVKSKISRGRAALRESLSDLVDPGVVEEPT